MKRQEHKAEVKRKILKISRELFKRQGYQTTTIRQITKAANVKIGTIYHFFKDKEDIFAQMVSGVFDRVLEKVDIAAPNTNNACLRMALEIKLHLQAILDDKRSAELYYITYTSNRTSKEILNKQIERIQHLWYDKNLSFTEEDYAIRALFVKGNILAISIQRLNEQLLGEHNMIEKSIRLILQMFETSKERIDLAIQQMNQLIVAQAEVVEV